MRRRRPNDKLAALGRVALFAGCSKRELATIGRIADEIDLREGKQLIREGEPGRQFFILLEGHAEVRRKGRKLRLLGPGDFFGEIALVSDRPTTASVTTISPTRAAVITRQSFRTLLRTSPGVQLKVLHALAERVPLD